MVEGHLRLEGEHGIERPGVHLHEDAPAGGRGLLDEIEVGTPVFRRPARAEHAPGLRDAGIDREVTQAFVIIAQALGTAPRRLAGDFEDTAPRLAYRADDGPHLVPVRDAARHRTVVRGDVIRGPGGRKPDGSGLDRCLCQRAHPRQFVRRRLVRESPLAHHVGPQRGVADVTRVVDAFRQRVDRVEELRKGLPGPLDAGLHRFRRDVLRALEIAEHEPGVLLRAGGEGEAAVPHDDAGDAVVRRA